MIYVSVYNNLYVYTLEVIHIFSKVPSRAFKRTHVIPDTNEMLP